MVASTKNYSKMHSLSSNHTTCTCPRSIECGSLFIGIFFTIVLKMKSPKGRVQWWLNACDFVFGENSIWSQKLQRRRNDPFAEMVLEQTQCGTLTTRSQRSAQPWCWKSWDGGGILVLYLGYSWMPGCWCFQRSRWKNAIIFGQKLPESKVQHTS